MKNSNILISIAIVLCIAAGVTAYGLSSDDNILSSLSTFTPEEDSVDTSTDSSDDSGSDGSNSGSNGGSQSQNSGSGGSGSSSTQGMSSNEAKKIVNSNIEEPGAYAGKPVWNEDTKLWYVPICNEDGSVIGGMEVNPKTGHTDMA